MSREEARNEPRDETSAASEALAAPDAEAAVRNAVALWAEQNTRPETLDRTGKLGGVSENCDWLNSNPVEPESPRPAPAAELPAGALHRDGRGVAVGHAQFAQAPARHAAFIVAAQQCGRLARHKRHVEARERTRETFAAGLDVRLLARPAVEESLPLQLGRQGEQRLDFERREVMTRELSAVNLCTHVFDVNADRAREREGVEREAVRVGQVEVERLAGGELWFAVGVRLEIETLGRAAEVAAEQRPQEPAPRDEVARILLEVVAACAREFLRGEEEAELSEDVSRLVERRAPDVNLAGV